jgi:uncharacterized lipoprotein NlpE involved in copper resistance
MTEDMKKIILTSLVSLALVACNTKQEKAPATDWEQVLVGEWYSETVGHTDTLETRYELTMTLDAFGKITEKEHYYAKGNGEPIIDRDGNIFTGTWKISKDSLIKDGKMSIVKERKYAPGEELERVEGNAKGFNLLVSVTADTLRTLDLQGDTVVFVRKR